MGAPILQVFLTTAPATPFNVSAATCPGGVWSELQGFTGADWVQTRGGGGTIRKTEGNGQITVNPGGASVDAPQQNERVIQRFAQDVGESGTGINSHDVSAMYVSDGPAIGGADITAPAGMEFTRTINVLGAAAMRGAYSLTASLSDASAPPITMSLSNNVQYRFDTASISFQCVFRGGSPSATLLLAIRNTRLDNPGNYLALLPQLVWMPIPVKTLKPRSAKSYSTWIGSIAG